MDSIEVTNTEEFQYKNLSKPIELAAGKRFLIRYFNENHNSVYDAILPPKYNPDNYLYLPLQIGDIEVETVYYNYHYVFLGKPYIGEEGVENSNRFRGLLDFKYERVK